MRRKFPSASIKDKDAPLDARAQYKQPFRDGSTHMVLLSSDGDFDQLLDKIIKDHGWLSGAKDAPTFLFAQADLVASFELYNINSKKLEALLHNFFASARLEIKIPDRFGRSYRPKEWFCVSLDTIQDAVEKLKEGSLTGYQFNVETGLLERV